MGNVQDIDHGWKRIVREVGKMQGSHVKVGVLSDAGTYPTDEGGANYADVATFNEFGTSTIPARPFMAQSFDKNIREINEFIIDRQNAIYDLKEFTEKALDKLGVFFVAKVKDVFTSGDFARNAPATIAAKGSSRPLIDTGRLRASINHKVVMG